MSGTQRRDAGNEPPADDGAVPEDVDAVVDEEDPVPPVVRPVRKKIGEGDTNLRDREASLARRRGGRKEN
jgi:hypothetical protein